MKLNNLNLSTISQKHSVALNKNQYKTQPNFCSKCDIIDFSQKSNDKLNIMRELIALGYTPQEAQNLVNKHFKTDTYTELTQGYDDEEHTIMHWIEIDRHLTPTEAILYMENKMDDYYLQHTNSGSLPLEFKHSSGDAAFYKIGEANFLPADLAKYMQKGFDIVMSGMILKGKIDEETAQNIQKYYDLAQGSNYKETNNVQQAEYTISLIIEKMDEIKALTSDETNENGELTSGFTRPLTNEEAVTLITNTYMPQDANSINKYIKLNEHLGYDLYGMEIYDLWDKDPDELIEKREAAKANKSSNVEKMPQTRKKFKTLQEAFEYFNDKTSGIFSEFFEDIAQLDDKKFRKLISIRHMTTEAMLASVGNRELRQKNIQILNSFSDELLEKMTTDAYGDRHKIDCIASLLKAESLEERATVIEKALENGSDAFDFITREALLDYLTNSNIHTETKKSAQEFLNSLYGKNTNTPEGGGQIIAFPKKND